LNEHKKVVKYRKPFNINIGVIIFIIIFIYLVFNVFTYITTTHTSVYEVEQGTMAENNVYRGLNNCHIAIRWITELLCTRIIESRIRRSDLFRR